ncbi:MAG: DUF1697 domain-containing protein [Sandaracinaceae bacterium]|nr:DUF1697 domain-containing protein [Sandaracinaceae bacterium]
MPGPRVKPATTTRAKRASTKPTAPRAASSNRAATKTATSTPRTHAAFLRGVMPTNCKMSELAAALSRGPFTNVATVLGSGNVVFTTALTDRAAIERALSEAMQRHLGRVFVPYVRSLAELEALVAADPFAPFALSPSAKRVVTFLPAAPARTSPPSARHGAQILAVRGTEALTAYERSEHGPVFMELLTETFGDAATTRTWDTLLKVLGKR